MPMTKTVPPHLIEALAGCHPFISSIVNVALNHDRQLSPSRKTIVVFIAGRIATGQREVSHDEVARGCSIATENVRKGLSALTGEYLEAERNPGPRATRWRLKMPTSIDVPINQRPSNLKPEPLDGFDADRHREIGRKHGFTPAGTDALIELRRIMREPPRRKG